MFGEKNLCQTTLETLTSGNARSFFIHHTLPDRSLCLFTIPDQNCCGPGSPVLLSSYQYMVVIAMLSQIVDWESGSRVSKYQM
jgi:hypothetical protein